MTMNDLVLTDEQARIVTLAAGPIAVRDAQGNVLGQFEPRPTPEMIAELKRRARAAGPRYTGAQVQARLQALQDEWDRTGEFDEATMRQFLDRLNQADPGHTRPRDGTA